MYVCIYLSINIYLDFHLHGRYSKFRSHKCVVYKATVTETNSNNQETYIGLTENEFKTRFNLHKSSLRLKHKRTATTLSDHVWKLKKKNADFNIKWDIVKRVKPFTPGEKVCKLCVQENVSILISKLSLNKRSDIFGHCMHKKQFLLNNVKGQNIPPATATTTMKI